MEDGVVAGEVERVGGEVDASQVEPAGVLLLERRVVVVGQAVDADDLVTGGEEPFGEVRADEPGCAGDGVAHGGEG